MGNDSETRRVGVSKFLQWIPLAAACIALATLFLNVAARKKELTCTLLSTSNLVSVDPTGIHPDLRMEFQGNRITSLSRMEFSIRNTGAAAVKAEDVREPLVLTFPAEVQVFSARVDRTNPQGFPFTVAVTGKNQVQVAFPLLNSGDEATFSIFLLNSSPGVPILSGRIVDVPNLLFTSSADATQPGVRFPIHSHSVRQVAFWIVALVNGALVLLAVVVVTGIVTDYVRTVFWRRSHEERFWELYQKGNEEEAKENLRLEEEMKKTLPGFVYPRRLRQETRDPGLAMIWASVQARKAIEEAKIPEYPKPLTSTLTSTVSVTLSAVALGSVFVFVIYVAHFALKG